MCIIGNASALHRSNRKRGWEPVLDAIGVSEGFPVICQTHPGDGTSFLRRLMGFHSRCPNWGCDSCPGIGCHVVTCVLRCVIQSSKTMSLLNVDKRRPAVAVLLSAASTHVPRFARMTAVPAPQSFPQRLFLAGTSSMMQGVTMFEHRKRLRCFQDGAARNH